MIQNFNPPKMKPQNVFLDQLLSILREGITGTDVDSKITQKVTEYMDSDPIASESKMLKH